MTRDPSAAEGPGSASTAGVEGPEWGARARPWSELCAPMSEPAWRVIADATGIGTGMRVLDVACGSGEFCALAAGRGASVSGIDAAGGMIEIARARVPAAHLRVGPMERLPWADAGFDVVTAFNAVQFAADPVVALAEARRVVRPDGRVAVCNWGGERELFAVLRPLGELSPPKPGPARPAVGEPGVLEDLFGRAGLTPGRGGEVDVPFTAPDLPALERALLAGAGFGSAIEHAGEETVRRTLADTAAPFRRADGSYRFGNRFRYLVGARAP